jgi:hypothetical protein
MAERTFDIHAVRDLSPDLLDENARLRVMPAVYYAQTSLDDRIVFCVRNGLYGLLTVELIDFLRAFTDGKKALEIGAGHGGLARALNILATDNCMQDLPEIREYYRALSQPPIRYGENVQAYDAIDAVATFQPEVVVASWVTHRYDEGRHKEGGNFLGVVEEEIIANCQTYVFIGNDQVHQNKSIWKLPHRKITPPWLYSRSFNGSADFIAWWGETPGKVFQQAAQS